MFCGVFRFVCVVLVLVWGVACSVGDFIVVFVGCCFRKTGRCCSCALSAEDTGQVVVECFFFRHTGRCCCGDLVPTVTAMMVTVSVFFPAPVVVVAAIWFRPSRP